MDKFPNALVIMLAVILLAWLMTFIIPKGEYQRRHDPDSGRVIVVPDSYSRSDAKSLSVFGLMMAIPQGIIGRADVLVLILLTGGCFYVLERTGAVGQGLVFLTIALKGKEAIALAVVSLMFLAGGAMTGMQEEVIAMTPVILIFVKGIGYNAFVAVAISFGSAVLGSSFSPINPFAVILAQREAGVALLSGSEFRLIALVLAFGVWMVVIMRYANKNRIVRDTTAEGESKTLTARSVMILGLLAFTFLILIWGMIFREWSFNEISAGFFVLGIAAGIIGNLGINGTSEAYIAGFREMTFAAVIVGLANSITLVLKQGVIIDSIVYGLFVPMSYLPQTVSGVAMMVSHSLLHFPVPSYSGQAMMTMPVLIPLSDLLGISRQVCILAYQYGAVMMDLLVPTNGALMAIIALCGISYNRWIGFVVKPLLIILAFAAVSIIVAVFVGF